MSDLTVNCRDCGSDFVIELAKPGTVAHRWVSALAEREPRCQECFDRHEAEAEEQERLSARAARRNRSQLPAKLQGRRLDQLKPRNGQQAAISAAAKWAKSQDAGGLMLTGDTGVGKSMIAGASCWTRLEHFACSYASVARSMARLGGSFTDEGRAEAVRVFSGAGPIVLDDLDKTRPSEYGMEQLFAAVDAREQAGAPLLVTTNLTPSEIGERYGDPLMSRLAGYCRTVRVDGEDWRVAR